MGRDPLAAIPVKAGNIDMTSDPLPDPRRDDAKVIECAISP